MKAVNSEMLAAIALGEDGSDGGGGDQYAGGSLPNNGATFVVTPSICMYDTGSQCVPSACSPTSAPGALIGSSPAGYYGGASAGGTAVLQAYYWENNSNG